MRVGIVGGQPLSLGSSQYARIGGEKGEWWQRVLRELVVYGGPNVKALAQLA